MANQFKLDSLSKVAEAEEAGSWVDVQHPAGGELFLGNQDKVPVRIRVAGSYSKTARAEQRRNRDEGLKRRDRVDAAELERREVASLAACTLEWEGMFDDDGKEIPLTKENARMVYAEAPFIADQVNAAGGDHAAFFEKGT